MELNYVIPKVKLMKFNNLFVQTTFSAIIRANSGGRFEMRLTFITLLVGGLGAIAGVWGMNFEVDYFKSAETGFWLTIGAMGFLILGLTTIAKVKNWI